MEQHWLDNAGYHACNQSLNKQFKGDSQRSAFLVLLQVKCLWHNALGLGGSVAHPLIGRYIKFTSHILTVCIYIPLCWYIIPRFFSDRVIK